MMFLMTAVALLGVGEGMPALKGEALSGATTVLPQAAAGRVTLVAFGFSYGSRHAVEAWTGRFKREFGARPGVDWYQVPMMGGGARLGRVFIEAGMRRGTAKADQAHVLTVYSSVEAWKQRLGYQAAGDAYLVLIDEQGIVRWRHAGVVTEEAYGALARVTAGLLAGRGP